MLRYQTLTGGVKDGILRRFCGCVDTTGAVGSVFTGTGAGAGVEALGGVLIAGSAAED